MELDECMICLEPLEYDVAILNCNHKIHYKCIQQWIETKTDIVKLCPVCDINGEIINIVDFKDRKVKEKKKTNNCILM